MPKTVNPPNLTNSTNAKKKIITKNIPRPATRKLNDTSSSQGSKQENDDDNTNDKKHQKADAQTN